MMIPAPRDVKPEEEILTPPKFAARYGWSLKILKRLVKTKGFPSFKINDESPRRYIEVKKVKEWHDKQMQKPKPYR